MKQAVIQIKDQNLLTYNLEVFQEDEQMIAFSLEDWEYGIGQLRYLMEKSTIMAEQILKGQVK